MIYNMHLIKNNTIADAMSRMHRMCNEDDLITNGVLYEEIHTASPALPSV